MSNRVFPQKYIGYILYQKCDVQHFIGMTINTIYNFVQIKKKLYSFRSIKLSKTVCSIKFNK